MFGRRNLVWPSTAGTGLDYTTQRVLKETFGDAAFAAAHNLSAVNSINIARVLSSRLRETNAKLAARM